MWCHVRGGGGMVGAGPKAGHLWFVPKQKPQCTKVSLGKKEVIGKNKSEYNGGEEEIY